MTNFIGNHREGLIGITEIRNKELVGEMPGFFYSKTILIYLPKYLPYQANNQSGCRIAPYSSFTNNL
jgi:hypothetical protein